MSARRVGASKAILSARSGVHSSIRKTNAKLCDLVPDEAISIDASRVKKEVSALWALVWPLTLTYSTLTAVVPPQCSLPSYAIGSVGHSGPRSFRNR